MCATDISLDLCLKILSKPINSNQTVLRQLIEFSEISEYLSEYLPEVV